MRNVSGVKCQVSRGGPASRRRVSASRGGQAVVLVLLSMAVVLVVILSVVSRSITDISVTSRSEEANRAFSAAEAGIEQALIVGAGSSEATQIGNASFTASVDKFSSGVNQFVSPNRILSGDSAVFWFVGHSDSGAFICDASHSCFAGSSFDVCWGNPGTEASAATAPAAEIAIFYDAYPSRVSAGNLADVAVARLAADPNSSRLATNHFVAADSGSCTIDGESFAFHKNVDLTEASLAIPSTALAPYGLLFAKIRLFYNTDTGHKVGLLGPAGQLFPSQGMKIDSIGTAGEATRKITVFQDYGSIPPIFESAIFSLGGVAKDL